MWSPHDLRMVSGDGFIFGADLSQRFRASAGLRRAPVLPGESLFEPPVLSGCREETAVMNSVKKILLSMGVLLEHGNAFTWQPQLPTEHNFSPHFCRKIFTFVRLCNSFRHIVK